MRAFTEKLMMYAVGRELEYFDMPQVRAVVRRAAAQDYRLVRDRLGHRGERCVPHAGGRMLTVATARQR